jgi:hypothetical protein
MAIWQGKKNESQQIVFRPMTQRVTSPADRSGSISEEGVATAPSVGWQNPPDGKWRQMIEHWQI